MVSKPYGNLVGVRPGKLADNMLALGFPPAEVAHRLVLERGVDVSRARLLVEVGLTQQRILAPQGGRSELVAMYVSIPFCPSRCAYCSFPSHSLEQYRRAKREQYFAGLLHEIEAVAEEMDRLGLKLCALYIGGGTPSTLDAAQIHALLDALSACPAWENQTEVTFEAGRPDTLDESKLASIPRGYRLSINPQSMHDETLAVIGRRHSAQDIRESFALARSLGFANINMDLIVGLPGEAPREIGASLEQVLELKPESITLHMFSPKRASRFGSGEVWERMSDKDARAASDLAATKLRPFMHPYYLYRQRAILGGLENTGWSVPGKECLYNIMMIAETHGVIGVGAGANSIFPVPGEAWRRHANPKDAALYLKRLPELLEEKRALLCAWRKKDES
ncbi:MAG: Oxygen-independent coproporphyrinogen-III oxidase-like protein HemZ [Firmicutes bacterium]|nr:Oxygen-independent coproporphyrinogen-III oxidase-like protein HemZ [candidate division NPL-UPA2 bacterium]